MNIYYCDICRRRISSIEVDKGLAVVQNADGVFCSDCAGEIVSAEPEPAEAHKTPSGSRNRRTPAKGRAVVANAASVVPRRTTQAVQRAQRQESNHYRYAYIQPPPEKVKTGKPLSLVMCAVIGGGVLAFGAIILVVNSWASKPDPKAKAEKPAKKPGVSIHSIDAAENSPRRAPAGPVSAEDSAREAFTKLEADWKALGPGEVAKRISLGEKFLADHSGTIIASRVRVKIEEFRKDKQTASH
jgi:hypothetical protein